MAIQQINLGTYANDGTGDDLRTAFEKVNANLVELYSISGGANIGSVPPISGVEEGELWWSTVEGRLYIYYSGAWIDSSPVDGFVEYDISAVATTGGANIRLSGTDLSQDNIKIASSTNITVTQTDANTITLSSTSYTGNVTGNLTGNADTVTNGVYTNNSYADPTWITSIAGNKVSGNISGNAGSVTNGVYTTGDQTIGGTKTFSNTISGSISGNAGSVTNGVYTNGSYADPIWITSLAGSKVSGNISGNAGSVTNGVYTTSSVNALADVDTVTATPTIGQALIWNGTNWVPGSVAVESGNNNFNFGGFNKIFTDPISYLLDKTGIDMGTFALPAEESVDLGTF
jgi:hypothetical protein